MLRLLDQGAVACNGRSMRRANKGDLLRAGDRLRLMAAYANGEAPLADDSVDLDICQAGDGWLVVNKPAGMPVRPHALDEIGTVVNAAVSQHPKMVGVGEGGLRSGVVHRLDTDTSGAMILATSQPAWDRLREAFTEHRFEKHYFALVHGSPEKTGSIKRDLRVAVHQPARVLVEPEGQGDRGARTCSLGWRVIERFGDSASLIDVDLHTGFLHQVRVMMNDLGHPVVGDAVYGSGTSSIQASRQMLHANSLEFEEVQAEAPVPTDMQQVLQSLRG
ncbi:MAG: pseudouridine synthase [Planctomycetota bacterium]